MQVVRCPLFGRHPSMEQVSNLVFRFILREVPLSVRKRVVISERYKSTILLADKLVLNCLNYLLQSWSNFFLIHPWIVMCRTVTGPKYISTFRCYLVYFVKNIVHRVLRYIAGVWAIWWCSPFACFYRALASLRLVSAAIGKSTVSSRSHLVLSVKVGIRKMNKGNFFSLTKRCFAILLIDESVLIRLQSTQNACYIFIKVYWFIYLRTYFNCLRTKVFWS